MQLLWRTINFVSVLTEEYSQSNSAVAIFSFHTEFHHLFDRQFTRALDVIQSYVTGGDMLVFEMITGVRRR